jgi:SHS2 domain-containing protein
VYRWVEHTGELEIEIEAPSEGRVFEEGFEAMRELFAGELKDVAQAGSAAPSMPANEPNATPAARWISLAGIDRAVLLADWLAELAYLAETGMVPARLRSLELSEQGLEAEIETVVGSPPHLVKAVTYHRLALEPATSGWRATVILDV